MKVTEAQKRSVVCPTCLRGPGNPCVSSRIPAPSTFGGGWGGPPDLERAHRERRDFFIALSGASVEQLQQALDRIKGAEVMTRISWRDMTREQRKDVIARAVHSVVAIGRDETVVKGEPIKLVRQGVTVVPRCAHCYEPATQQVVVEGKTKYVCDWHHHNKGGK